MKILQGIDPMPLRLASTVMGFSTLIPHLLGVPVQDGRALAPEGANVPCPYHLDILLFQRAASGSGGGTNIM
jgi:hypothetical protein